MKKTFSILIAALLAATIPGILQADRVRVAAAANFRDAISEIAAEFEAQDHHEIVLILGSTGKHYAQIVNGAPFDVFFAADAERPEKLELEGLSVPGRRFTYAIGRLALWSADKHRVDPEGRVLTLGDYRHLAIANPRLAPYGRAARETLVGLGLWERVSEKIVVGENVGQAFQFVNSGNAELGLVAWPQLHRGGPPSRGSWWLVPESFHAPIEQQAVLLKPGEAAQAFFEFVRSETAVEIIRRHGYGVPDDF